MFDVGVDLLTEGWVAEAQTQAGARQVVQQLRCGDAVQVISIEAEGLDECVTQGRCLIADGLSEARHRRLFLVSTEGVLKQGGQDTITKQGATKLSEWEAVQPVPGAEIEVVEPGGEHYQEDACQGERNGQQGCFDAAEAMQG